MLAVERRAARAMDRWLPGLQTLCSSALGRDGAPVSGSTGAVNGLPSVVGQPMGTPESDSGAGAATSAEWPLVTSLALGALPTAPGRARLHAKSARAEWD